MHSFNNMKIYVPYLESCYRHIFENTLVHSWGYFYFDLDGQCLQLMSDKSLLDVFLKNDLFADQISNNLAHRHDLVYGSDIINDKMLISSVRETLIDKQYAFFFDIVNKHEHYTEICTFATLIDANQSNNFILNNMEILKMIAQDLARRCRRLLTSENTFILPKDFIIEMNVLSESRQAEDSVNLRERILGQKNTSSKLQAMVKDSAFDFSKLPFNFMSAKELTLKEKEIIYLYYYGFNAPRIGNILDISKRTVDKHFENIKRKLDCYSTGQIIPVLLRANISINCFLASS